MKCFWIWTIGLLCFASAGCSGKRLGLNTESVIFQATKPIAFTPAEKVDAVGSLESDSLADKANSGDPFSSASIASRVKKLSAKKLSAKNQEVSLASFAQQSDFDDEVRSKKESSRRTNGKLKNEKREDPETEALSETEDKKKSTTGNLNQDKNNRESETDSRPPLATDFSNVIAPTTTSAATSISSYSLNDIEQWALSNNPSLSAAQAVICKAQGLHHQVGILPNPTFGISSQQLADAGTDQHLIFLEREFVRGDKLRLNREVLSQTTAAQQRELETQQHRVLTDVRVLFYEAIAAQQQVEAARLLQATAKRGVEIARDRLKAEEGTRIEVLQSETLLSEITLTVERTEIAYRAAWKELAAIAGLPPAVPIQLVGELATNKTDLEWDEVYEQIVLQSPELSTARAIVCEKSAMVRRQQVQAIPNLTGQLGAGYDNGTSSGMINVQLSAPIPTVNKNHGNISAASADYQLAVENVRRIEQSIKARLSRVAQEYESALASVNKYENEIIPQSTSGLELSETAYKAGELDFLQVLILRRSYFESSIRLIESRSQLAQAYAKIEGLLLNGGLTAPQDYTDGDGLRSASFGGE